MLIISKIPVETVFMTLMFPSILHRIDSVLIACDACQLLGLEIEPRLALEAMTKDSDNTDDHLAEQINFQTGMGRNYERLEFLGDTFLKMATTISIFTLNPNNDEFTYHVERMVLLCNRNLFNHAVDRNLQEYIRSKSFDRRSWYPDLKLLKGKAPPGEMAHNLADKSIADVCEALIGAAYLNSTDGSMDMAVKAVTKMVKSKNHQMKKFEDYYASFKVPSWHFPEQVSQVFNETAKSIGNTIGYDFKSVMLVLSATKHPSWHAQRDIPNYQQLEFLGDALLDMVFVDYLYQRYPDADPQQLTEYKMVMVSNQFLGFLCVRLGLHKQLRYFNQQLFGQIDAYVQDLQRAEQAAREDEANGAEERIEYWLDVSAAPKALPDIMEAIVGAMFIDSEYNYDVVRRFAENRILPFFQDMELYNSYASKHPVTVLGKRLRGDFGCVEWRWHVNAVPCSVDEGVKAVTATENLASLMIHRKVIASATGVNGRTAKSAVAKNVNDILADMSLVEFRHKYGCSCGKASVHSEEAQESEKNASTGS
jgi:endoribonuclease Dicer